MTPTKQTASAAPALRLAGSLLQLGTTTAIGFVRIGESFLNSGATWLANVADQIDSEIHNPAEKE
ncbi:MAG: hypothetical protein HRU17_18660 [Polyangiaceae bacterium]|nr:hypothetical protein [Polyangiaceae bacterium]